MCVLRKKIKIEEKEELEGENLHSGKLRFHKKQPFPKPIGTPAHTWKVCPGEY